MDRALKSIDRHGELPRPIRVEVRRILEGAPERPWLRLELASARRVMPIWLAQFAATDVLDLLNDAHEHVVKAAVSSDLSERAAALHGRLEQALYDAGETGRFVPVYAGFAAWAAITATVGESEFVEGDSELDVDPLDWDASFYASLAVAGGAVWDQQGDPELRAEFWRWWITEAGLSRD